MTDDANGRVTTREFYDAQLDTNKTIADLKLETEKRLNELSTKMDEVIHTVAESCAIHETLTKSSEETDGKIEELKKDLTEHKLSDNRWKGITGFIQAVIAGVVAAMTIDH